MTCQLCNQPGEHRDRFKAVLCHPHYLEALLALLGDRPREKLMMETYSDEAQGSSPNPLHHPRLRA